MKKISFLFLSALLILSLASCGGKPSDAKIKAALEAGTITREDAMDKGWIDDQWIAENFETTQAGDKIHPFDAFETTYLDGTPAASSLIAGKMCLVFFNTEQPETLEKLQVFWENAAEMEEIGVPILGIITDKDSAAARETLADAPFPIVVYNEEMQTALASYGELLAMDVVSVFTKDGGFYSAWITQTTGEDMLGFAQNLADEE